MLHWLLHHILDIYSWAIPALGWGFNRRRFVSHRSVRRSAPARHFLGGRTIGGRAFSSRQASHSYSRPSRGRSVFSGVHATAHARVSRPAPSARHSSLAGNIVQGVIPTALRLTGGQFPTRRTSLFSGARVTAGYGPRVPYLSTTAAQRGFIRALQLGAPRKTAVALLSAGLKNPSLFHQPHAIKGFLRTAAKYQNAFHNPTYIAAKVAGGNPNDYLNHSKVADTLVSQFAHATIPSLPKLSQSGGVGKFPLLELIHTPLGFSYKNGQQVAPYAQGGHYNHVHVASDPNNIVKLGKLAQKMGLHVGENPHFGGVTQGVHATNSYHYSGRAIDVSGNPGQMLKYARTVQKLYKSGGSSKPAQKLTGSAYHQLRQASRAGIKPQLRPAPKPYWTGGVSLSHTGLTPEQQKVAATGLSVARRMGASKKVQQALIEAGIVESGLRNLSYGDRDSRGYLQQRPSQGWPNVMNVKTATKSFVSRAKAVERQYSDPGSLAQAVQRSAFPGRYSQHAAEAARIVSSRSGKRKLVKPKQGQNALLQRAYAVPHRAGPSPSTSTGTSAAPVAVGTSGRSSAPTSTSAVADPTGLVNTPLDLSALQSFAQPRVSAGIQSPFFSSSVVTPNATPTSTRPYFRAPRPRSRYYR
jgi:hypothetical protein